MPFQFSNTPVYVSEGQTVRFKYKAPSSWDTTQSVTIQIGLQQTIWYITTIPEDFAPDPFPFTPLEEAEVSTLYVYGDGSRPGESIITVSGLTPSTEAALSLSSNLEILVDNVAIRIKRVSLGETEFGPWTTELVGRAVTNTDEIQCRLKSNAGQGLETFLDLTIGARTERWTITTKVTPPNVPVPFPEFIDILNAPLDTNVYSNIIQVQGLNDVAIISVDNPNCYIGVSNTNSFFTNADGYEVLSDTTFELSADLPVITNGQYLQLYITTPTTALTTTSNILSIGDATSGSNWSVRTGNFPSRTPDNFIFTDISDVVENSVIASDPAPVLGITGLGNNVEVDVVLVSTTGTEPRIKIVYAEGGESSVGIFPTKVNNGDSIVLYNRSSSTFGAEVQTTIKVGTREILPWRIVTNTGPDTDAIFNVPANLTNRRPNIEVVSSIITVTGINRPIQINATNGAMISIDFDSPVVGPRTFTPGINTSFRLYLTTSPNLSGVSETVVTVGTGTANNPFTWSVSNYAVEPPPPELKGSWYSIKNAFVDINGDIRHDKQDGYAIGTVVPVLKQPDGTYGDLAGQLTSKLDARFPGYLECDGALYNCADFPDLFEVIENTYGGSGTYNAISKTYSGTFRVPDFRNRKLAGTGVVDGNRASSAFLPAIGGIVEPGGIGGWWYVDDVDVAGDNPYEIITGATTNQTTGTTSNFFSIGTVKTVFNAPLTADIDFTITGSVTALVGPLLDKIVNVPTHTHFVVTGQVDGTTGDPQIEWDARALMGLSSSSPTGVLGGAPLNSNLSQFPDNAARNQTGDVADLWLEGLTAYAPLFETEWNTVDGEDTLRSIVRDMVGRANTEDYSGGEGAPDGSASDQESEVIRAATWWPSPYSVVSDTYFANVSSSGDSAYEASGPGGGGARRVTAVIDTNPISARIDAYSPPIQDGDDNTVVGHSHLITLQPVTNPFEDYSYGNVGGFGSARVGLGSAANAINVSFNQSEVGLELNTGTFTLNTSVKKPIPDVVFSPNRKVPLLPPFHKVKYIIKAF